MQQGQIKRKENRNVESNGGGGDALKIGLAMEKSQFTFEYRPERSEAASHVTVLEIAHFRECI